MPSIPPERWHLIRAYIIVAGAMVALLGAGYLPFKRAWLLIFVYWLTPVLWADIPLRERGTKTQRVYAAITVTVLSVICLVSCMGTGYALYVPGVDPLPHP
jgi:hypothetical protein